jgi:hypothetical protein
MTPLNDTEREQIRRYLGYPASGQITVNVSIRCDAVLAEAPAAIETVRELLRELARLDQQRKNVTPFAAQSFSSSAAGTRQFFPGQQMAVLKEEQQRLTAELSETLSLSIYRDIYAAKSGQAHTLR